MEDVGSVYVTTVMVTIFIIVIGIFWACRKGVEPIEEIYVIDNDDISSDIMVVNGYMIDADVETRPREGYMVDSDTRPPSPSSIDLNGVIKTYPLDSMV